MWNQQVSVSYAFLHNMLHLEKFSLLGLKQPLKYMQNSYDIIMWYGKCQYMHLHQYAIGITVNGTIAGEVIHYIRVFDCSVRIQVDKILVSFIQWPIASYSLLL